MRDFRTPFHSNADDCADPVYWLDWAQDDLAYGFLTAVLECGARPDRLEAIATGFRQRLAASGGFARVVASSPPPDGLERAIRAWQRAFVAFHHPELHTRVESPRGQVLHSVDPLLVKRVSAEERHGIAEDLAAALLNGSARIACTVGPVVGVEPQRRGLYA